MNQKNDKQNDVPLTFEEFRCVCDALQYGFFDLHSCNCTIKQMIVEEVVDAADEVRKSHPDIDVDALCDKIETLSSRNVGDLVEACNELYRVREMVAASAATRRAGNSENWN